MNRGAWWATFQGVTNRWTCLSDNVTAPVMDARRRTHWIAKEVPKISR